MNLILYLLIGGAAGLLAAKIVGLHARLLGDMIIGGTGALIGGLLSRLVTSPDQSYFAITGAGLLWSVVGALIFATTIAALHLKAQHHHFSI